LRRVGVDFDKIAIHERFARSAESYSLALSLSDMRNLPSIRKMGGLYARHYLNKKGVTEFRPGGNEWSLSADEISGMDTVSHPSLRAARSRPWPAMTFCSSSIRSGTLNPNDSML
jgi:hypothetical protein